MSKPEKQSNKLLGVGLVVLAAALIAAGVFGRRTQAEQLKASAVDSVPTVSVQMPGKLASAPLELPARVEPWSRAPIYSRTSGYLKNWRVDIGGAVKAGQVLAEVETPDLDQQLLQAKAELATARSNLALAQSTATRWQGLLEADAVSRQEADEKAGDLAARQSNANALQANVERVQALQRYRTLVAPFDGVVTARNTDVGALISVGGEAGRELFVVSDIRRLRVYVNVPQRQVASIAVGSTAQLVVPERPGKTYTATVQSLAQAINTASGTMLVQLTVNNDGAELLPGGYASVRFDTPATAGALSITPSALIVNRRGTQVAVVDTANRVQLKPVTVARDLGNVIELASGVAGTDRVIGNPPDGIASGDTVRIAGERKGAM
jgi:RND family efflux transporter MFP subunit